MVTKAIIEGAPGLSSPQQELDGFVDGVLNGGPLPGKLKATRVPVFRRV